MSRTERQWRRGRTGGEDRTGGDRTGDHRTDGDGQRTGGEDRWNGGRP